MSGFRKYPVDLAMSIWRTVPQRHSQTCCAYIHGMAKNCFSERAVGTNPRTRNNNICIPWAQQVSIHIQQAWQRHAMHIHMSVHMYAKYVLYLCTHACLHASIVYLWMYECMYLRSVRRCSVTSSVALESKLESSTTVKGQDYTHLRCSGSIQSSKWCCA